MLADLFENVRLLQDCIPTQITSVVDGGSATMRWFTTLLLASVLTMVPGACWSSPRETLFAGAQNATKVVIAAPNGACQLSTASLRRLVGLAELPVLNDLAVRAGIVALAIPDPRDPATAAAPTSRLVVVDMQCKIVQVLKNYYVAPPANLLNEVLGATYAGYLDTSDEGGKWGSWNLRTNKWDPIPCCDRPPHFAPPLKGSLGSEIGVFGWSLLGYAVVAVACLLIAVSQGSRGVQIVWKGLVALPIKVAWLGIVLVVAANVYAIAGLLRSGSLGALAGGVLHSATRALRR
ncbi:MAG: hypothetical protein ABI702_03490 [Burkholderiales bacterium]